MYGFYLRFLKLFGLDNILESALDVGGKLLLLFSFLENYLDNGISGEMVSCIKVQLQISGPNLVCFSSSF